MRQSPNGRAFTLIEMLVVMAVIAILAGLILSTNSYAQKKAAIERAKGEIAALSAACENFKADTGVYPSTKDTEKLDPRKDGSPSSSKYELASLDLYKLLNADEDADGIPEKGGKSYAADFFNPSRMSIDKSSKKVRYLQDPFGNCYGYSTAGNKQSQEYRAELEKNPKAKRPTGPALEGYNQTFDLWSTGGVMSKGKGAVTEADQNKWVKNW